jgi:hypothetical protein
MPSAHRYTQRSLPSGWRLHRSHSWPQRVFRRETTAADSPAASLPTRAWSAFGGDAFQPQRGPPRPRGEPTRYGHTVRRGASVRFRHTPARRDLRLRRLQCSGTGHSPCDGKLTLSAMTGLWRFSSKPAADSVRPPRSSHWRIKAKTLRSKGGYSAGAVVGFGWTYFRSRP